MPANTRTPPVKNIFLNAIFLSILAHYLLFQFIGITFSKRVFPQNPAFIFLGAILDRHDFTSSSARQLATPEQIPLQLKARSKEKTLTPSATTAVKKPIFPKATEQRHYLKSSGLTSVSGEATKDIRLKELEQQIPVAPWNPLHFYDQ